MNKKRLFFILLPILFALLSIIILNCLKIPIIESRYSVDLNSGDSKFERYICSLRIQSRTLPTLFSREVRRLGIEIPKERILKFVEVRNKTL